MNQDFLTRATEVSLVLAVVFIVLAAICIIFFIRLWMAIEAIIKMDRKMNDLLDMISELPDIKNSKPLAKIVTNVDQDNREQTD